MQEALAVNPATPLRLIPAAKQEIEDLANIHAEMDNSRAGLASYYRYDPRNLWTLCNDDYNGVWIARPKIHHSVFKRIAAQRVTYIPHVVPADYDVVGPNGQVVPNTYETSQEAAQRNEDLKRAWDLVWWRRIVYLATVAVSVLLVLFPWIWEADETPACRGHLCFLQSAIAAVGNFLPSWLESWIVAFQISPGRFLTLAAALAALMWFGKWLENRIEARATEAWSRLADIKPVNGGRWGPLSRFARRVRETGWLVEAYRWTARELLPFLCFLLVLAVGFFAVNRVVMEFAEASGATCVESKGVRSIDQATVEIPEVFRTSDVCFGTGVGLIEGRTYVVEFRVTSDWADSIIRTWPEGFGSAKGGLIFRIAAPMRRSWEARWLEPVGRIGVLGRDRYKLNPRYDGPLKDAKGEGREIYVFTSRQFIAHNTGELFLFANDAALALPRWWLNDRSKWWSWFYDNNSGSAKVVIRAAAPPQASPPAPQ